MHLREENTVFIPAGWVGSERERDVCLSTHGVSAGFTPCTRWPIRSSSAAIFFNRWVWTCNSGRFSLWTVEFDRSFRSRIYELERLAQVPHKFQFPLFETFHWYAAKSFYEELKGTSSHSILLKPNTRHCFTATNESSVFVSNPITQQACESMVHYMNKWLINDKRVSLTPCSHSLSVHVLSLLETKSLICARHPLLFVWGT